MEHQGFCSDGAIYLHSPLENELSDGFVWYANLIFGKAKEQGSRPLTRHKTKRGQPQGRPLFVGGASRTRTLDRPVMSREL